MDNSGDPQAKISSQENNSPTWISTFELSEWCHFLITYCLLFCGVICMTQFLWGQTSQIGCFTTEVINIEKFHSGKKTYLWSHLTSVILWKCYFNISIKKKNFLTWKSLYHGWPPKQFWVHIHFSWEKILILIKFWKDFMTKELKTMTVSLHIRRNNNQAFIFTLLIGIFVSNLYMPTRLIFLLDNITGKW